MERCGKGEGGGGEGGESTQQIYMGAGNSFRWLFGAWRVLGGSCLARRNRPLSRPSLPTRLFWLRQNPDSPKATRSGRRALVRSFPFAHRPSHHTFFSAAAATPPTTHFYRHTNPHIPHRTGSRTTQTPPQSGPLHPILPSRERNGCRACPWQVTHLARSVSNKLHWPRWHPSSPPPPTHTHTPSAQAWPGLRA